MRLIDTGDLSAKVEGEGGGGGYIPSFCKLVVVDEVGALIAVVAVVAVVVGVDSCCLFKNICCQREGGGARGTLAVSGDMDVLKLSFSSSSSLFWFMLL